MDDQFVIVKAITPSGNIQEFRCKEILEVNGKRFTGHDEKDVRDGINYLNGRIDQLERQLNELQTNLIALLTATENETDTLPSVKSVEPDYSEKPTHEVRCS